MHGKRAETFAGERKCKIARCRNARKDEGRHRGPGPETQQVRYTVLYGITGEGAKGDGGDHQVWRSALEVEEAGLATKPPEGSAPVPAGKTVWNPERNAEGPVNLLLSGKDQTL